MSTDAHRVTTRRTMYRAKSYPPEIEAVTVVSETAKFAVILEREWKAHLAKVMTAYTGKVREWREANKWNKRNPKGASGTVPCEACGKGEIHLSMSAYNGHVHGCCTTEGCVKWME